MSARLSRDEFQWVFARAAALDAAADETVSEEVILTAATQAGLSPESVERALKEFRAGAIERQRAQRAARRGVCFRGGIAGIALAVGGGLGLAEGFNVGDLIPFGLLAFPYLYVRDGLRRLR